MTTMSERKSYSKLIQLATYEERFKYLSLRGQVGEATFGFDRYLNQGFYRSAEWRSIRRDVIARDNGCDMAVEGYGIHDRIYIHHLVPMRVEDLRHGADWVLDPEFLVCVTHRTHNAIHYGTESLLPRALVQRRPGDTKLW